MRKTNVQKEKPNSSTLNVNNSSIMDSTIGKNRETETKKEVFSLPNDCSDIFSRLIKIRNLISEVGKP